MTAWALVPLKHPDQAKTRLSPILDGVSRRALFFLMARQVLAAIGATPALAGAVVVTPSGEVAAFAQGLGARIIEDTRPLGTNEACAMACDQLTREGARRVLILPGDLPFILPADLERLTAGASPGIALVGDRRGEGTNALLLDPPDAIAPAFGPASFARHADAARQSRIPLDLPDLPALALDIDDVADYRQMQALFEGTETADWFAARAGKLDPALKAFCLSF